MKSAHPKIYEAARAFAQGKESREVQKILLECIDFDDDSAEDVLLSAQCHRKEIDNGYSSFIKIVNRILGTNVYQIDCSEIKIKPERVCEP